MQFISTTTSLLSRIIVQARLFRDRLLRFLPRLRFLFFFLVFLFISFRFLLFLLVFLLWSLFRLLRCAQSLAALHRGLLVTRPLEPTRSLVLFDLSHRQRPKMTQIGVP